MAMDYMDIPLTDIVLGERYRKNLGNLDELADSIKEMGLLHPIGLSGDLKLIYGQRRLEACKRLGMSTIRASISSAFCDAIVALKAERDENTCRMDKVPSELAALGKRLEEVEQVESEKRRNSKLVQNTVVENFHNGESDALTPETIRANKSLRGKTRDIVGSALGISGKTYEKMKAVIDSGIPELVEAMDSSKIKPHPAAEIAAMPKKDQLEILKLDKKGIRQKTKEVSVAKKAAKQKLAKVSTPETISSAEPTSTGSHIAESTVTDPAWPEARAPAFGEVSTLVNDDDEAFMAAGRDFDRLLQSLARLSECFSSVTEVVRGVIVRIQNEREIIAKAKKPPRPPIETLRLDKTDSGQPTMIDISAQSA